MNRYEYKAVTIRQKGLGIFGSREVPDLEVVLNQHGEDGWRLSQVILPSASLGESDKIIAVLERQLA